MDAKHVNVFIEAILSILETTAQTSAKAFDNPYLKEEPIAKGDITGVISISGNYNGTVSITYSEKLILHAVSVMFGEEMTEINDEIKDAVGELTNMISGQATTKLADLGTSLKAELTDVVMGSQHPLEHISGRPVIAMSYQTDNGDFTMEFCFEE
jgi:chemotaxis protein CheX